MADGHDGVGAQLAALPTELFDNILVRLEGHDLKQLRLARLFRRVCLSMLTADRDTFLHVALHPRLAKHVRILQWVVIPDSLPEVRRYQGITGHVFESDGKKPCFADQCWLPMRENRSDAINTLDAFRETLETTLDGLPRLDVLQLSSPSCSSGARKALLHKTPPPF
ncbi:hypothetical protein Micbo1qcDRAFT_208274 [Microdochium bolleyi]|uniref:F-box domain-containing protein n=1 Tax=Microdochium bolleyi TaxID=196109 RepID=A0A136IQU5_9PEZI|nr:hypothetical protein Micbo1qcDRAFT_208274 [Microdochium bolleyi]